MIRFSSKLLAIAFISVYCSTASASRFAYGIDTGAWQANSSIFACKLIHHIPYYGEAVFLRKAGEASQFFMSPKSERLKTGKASLMINAPVWKHHVKNVDLGYIPVKQSRQPIQLGRKAAERLLAELLDGMELEFVRAPWYGASESTTLIVAPIGFRAVYQEYQRCLESLLPVNFDQIKRTSVYFGSSKFKDLTAADRQKLNNIVLYSKADPKVKEFYIDGHTDAVGMRKDNLVLAEKRAQTVSKYLTANGLEKEKITIRWHGERYPVEANTTIKGRAKNRRVTIRLERIESPEMDVGSDSNQNPAQQ